MGEATTNQNQNHTHEPQPDETNGTEALPTQVRGWFTVWKQAGVGAVLLFLLAMAAGAYLCNVTFPAADAELKIKVADIESRKVEAAAIKASQERIAESQAVFLKQSAATMDKMASLTERMCGMEELQVKQQEQAARQLQLVTDWQNAWRLEIESQHKLRQKEHEMIMENQTRFSKDHEKQCLLLEKITEKLGGPKG